MARRPIERDLSGSAANGFKPTYMSPGDVINGYFETLQRIMENRQRRAEAAKAAGQLASYEALRKAAEHAEHRKVAAFTTWNIPRQPGWTEQDQVHYVYGLAHNAQESAHQAQELVTEDPERAAYLQWLGTKQQGMAEAGAFVLDWLHPLPGTEVWIDRITAEVTAIQESV